MQIDLSRRSDSQEQDCSARLRADVIAPSRRAHYISMSHRVFYPPSPHHLPRLSVSSSKLAAAALTQDVSHPFAITSALPQPVLCAILWILVIVA
ncbi:hypothetical protein KC354_g84 [Hortaea werneckii]|nr:hypothetical protein KC354_g84 [Hortaea werneckii]